MTIVAPLPLPLPLPLLGEPLPLPLLGDPLPCDPLPLPGAPEVPFPGDEELLGEEPLDGNPLPGAPEAPLSGDETPLGEEPLDGSPLPGIAEAPLSGDEEPLGEKPLDGDSRPGALLGPDITHSQAEARMGAKFMVSKHGEANSGYARVDGTQDSTQVQTPLSAGDLPFEFDSRALNFWQRA